MTRIRRIAAAGLGACAVMLAMAGPAGAITWRQVNTGTTESITAIDYHSLTQLRFTTGGGSIFVRRPDGSFAAEGSFPGRQFLDIAFRPSGDVGLAAADSGRLFRFAGGVWAPVSLANTSVDHDCPSTPQPPYARSTPTANVLAVAWSSDTVAWATTAAPGQVLKSVDAGATWVDAGRLPDGTCRLGATITDVGPITGSDADVYFVANGGVWRTIDGLASPASFKSSPLITCYGNPMRVAVDPANANRLSTAGPCLLNWALSLDAATSFKPIDAGDGTDLHDVAAGAGVFLAVGDNGEIRQTFDGSAFFKRAARGRLRRAAVAERRLRRPRPRSGRRRGRRAGARGRRRAGADDLGQRSRQRDQRPPARKPRPHPRPRAAADTRRNRSSAGLPGKGPPHGQARASPAGERERHRALQLPTLHDHLAVAARRRPRAPALGDRSLRGQRGARRAHPDVHRARTALGGRGRARATAERAGRARFRRRGARGGGGRATAAAARASHCRGSERAVRGVPWPLRAPSRWTASASAA